jgi:hypothetical protein
MEMSIESILLLIDTVRFKYENDYDEDDNSILIPLIKQGFIDEDKRQRELACEL